MITLQRGAARATINPLGGWLETFSVDGNEVLFPKSKLKNSTGEPKTRGGCHVCLPNFGPDVTGSLKQHGFARESEWGITSTRSDRASLSLRMAKGQYAGLCATLKFLLSERGISMKLRVDNKSKHDMRIAPAFHPYLKLSAEHYDIDRKIYKAIDMQETQTLVDTPRTITCDGTIYRIEATNLKTWIMWSDRLADYICIEPTQSGFSFATEPGSGSEIVLQSLQSWSCSVTLEVKSNKEIE